MVYVIYGDQGDVDNSYLKSWNGNSWETIGGGSISDNAGLDANFTFDNNNDIYAVYQDYDVSQAPASVKKLVDNNWEYLGEAGFPGTNCRYTSIAIDNEGAVFIAYVEMYNGQALTVAKYPQEIIAAPTQQSSDVVFGNIGGNSVDMTCTNGNGSKRAVFMKEGNFGEVGPIDNITYTANSIFGLGDEIDGWFCIYNGDDNLVSVSGLTLNTAYRAMVCDYNGEVGTEKYLTLMATGNPANFTTLIYGINETKKQDWVVYPNPSNGNFTIENLTGFHPDNYRDLLGLEITNFTGKTILTQAQEHAPVPLQIDVSRTMEHAPLRGIYFLKIITKDEIFTKKLIIQ